ncbi:hypothetical protein E8E11_009360 [Didymella keratinophila]|nr:hypothetical protein E8E11_009360 [Didymella keratinophila]
MSAEGAPSRDQAPGPTYDRDAIVASMLRYYKLLSKMVSINPTDIERAPREGRSDDDIPLEAVRLLGFNDEMIDFIRHAPFVGSNDRPVYYSTSTLNYYRHLFNYREEEYQLDDPHMVEMWPLPEQRIPEGIVPLSRPLQGDDRGTWWLLDTNNGELTAHGPCLERPSAEVPEGEQWRSARPMSATTYFDGLYEDLMSLRIVPLPGLPRDTEWDMWPTEGMRDRQRWADEAKKIYATCRWPTMHLKSELKARDLYDSGDWPTVRWFQRAKCRRLLIEMLERCSA